MLILMIGDINLSHCYMINLKIYMQEKENLARQLQKLQEQCVNDYLQSRLQTITSQQVIKEIIQGFIAMNNQQFFQSISQTIYSVKQQNKQLFDQMQRLKNRHKLEVEEQQVKLHQSEQLQERIKIELQAKLEEKLNQLRSVVEKKQTERQTLLIALQDQKIAKSSVQQLALQKEQLMAQIQLKLRQMAKQNNKLTIEVQKTKESGNRFKESCQKILKDSNKQKEIQKQKLIDSYSHEKQAIQNHIKQLEVYIRNKEKEWQEKSYLQEQQQERIVQNLKAELQAIKQRLSISQSQMLTKVAQLEHMSSNNRQLADTIKQISEDITHLQKQKQNTHLSNLYLQEENNYLRTQIISFDTRYKQLQLEKTEIQQTFQQYKTSTNTELQYSKRLLQKLTLQHKQIVQAIGEQTSTSLKQIAAELQFLKDREQIYKQNQNKLISRQEQLQTQLINCQQQNKCMTEQLQLHFSDNQIHQNQIQLYQQSIVKLNQNFRNEMQARKQSYETSWKQLNQQMLQEKYKCSVLRQQLDKAKEEIFLYHQKQQIYELYHQEIAQLKAQLALIGSYQAKNNVFGGDIKSKVYYLISRGNQEIKKLKKQNRYLRQSVVKWVSQHRTYMQQIFCVTVLKIRQQSLKCLFCEHQKTIKGTDKISNQQLMFKKTIPKLSNNQSVNYSNIKKALKSVNQRYQTLNQENKHYTDHIDGVISKI